MENKDPRTLSTEIAEMKIIVSGADGFVLYPAKDEVEEDKALMLHRHGYYEFFFATESPICIITEEGDRPFYNQLAIVPPSVMHCCGSCGRGSYCLTAKTEPHAHFFDAFSSTEITTLDVTGDMNFCINKLVNADLSSDLGRAKAETAIKLLFLEIAESARIKAESKRKDKTNAPDYEDEIYSYIVENFNSSKSTVKTLASRLYLSPKQVSRIIKKQYGCTFPQLMNQKRLSVAVMLLKNTSLSVTEIIDRLGFNSENYFYKLFKDYYGVTPQKWRKLKIKTTNF